MLKNNYMLKGLISEVTTLQDKERFLDKLLSQCISLVSFYKGSKNKEKVDIYVDRIEDSIHEYNLYFINEEGR